MREGQKISNDNFGHEVIFAVTEITSYRKVSSGIGDIQVEQFLVNRSLCKENLARRIIQNGLSNGIKILPSKRTVAIRFVFKLYCNHSSGFSLTRALVSYGFPLSVRDFTTRERLKLCTEKDCHIKKISVLNHKSSY